MIGLLDNLDIGRSHIAGLSLGAMVAMRLAARNPERVERLALLCTSAQLGPPQTWAQRAATVRAEGTAAVADSVVARWLTDRRRSADPQVTVEIRDMIAATPADGYASCCDAIREMDLRPDLAAISAPTLVIAGTDDPSAPLAHLQAIADGIANARLIEIPDARTWRPSTNRRRSPRHCWNICRRGPERANPANRATHAR